MSIYHLSNAHMALAAQQARAGVPLQRIARNLALSESMVACAIRKWPLVQKKSEEETRSS